VPLPEDANETVRRSAARSSQECAENSLAKAQRIFNAADTIKVPHEKRIWALGDNER